jgi:hypothetical protein
MKNDGAATAKEAVVGTKLRGDLKGALGYKRN